MLALRLVLTFVAMALVAGVVLFGAAGTLAWPMGWVYVILVSAVSVASRLLLLWLSPDTLRERANFAKVKGVEPGDRALVLIVGTLGPMAVLLAAGLDRRFGWTGPLPSALVWSAVAGTLLAAAFTTWAMTVNKFFSAVARIQSDRGHVVVSSGPYGWVRHPGYAGSIVATLAIPVMLGSLWALVPAGLTVIAIVIRTAREDRMLHRGLRDYREYAARTRTRLVPGIW
ncbi:MAG: isoprenylcysteine carboxylmethyltransferase family protein [Gemmatimonadetes bacterium]|nr:isoprenylcysteine carboxylmethyltransferase family protein [Gemmatimonadota bacterium]